MAMIAQLERIWQLWHFCSCILKKMIQESSWIWQLGKMPQPSWAQPGQLHRGARRDAESVNMHLHRTAKMILISAVCDNLQNIEYALAANRYSTMTYATMPPMCQFAKCAISLDVESKLYENENQKNLGLKKYLIEVLKRLPCYITTIVFRVCAAARLALQPKN